MEVTCYKYSDLIKKLEAWKLLFTISEKELQLSNPALQLKHPFYNILK